MAGRHVISKLMERRLRVLVDMDQTIADFEGYFLTMYTKTFPEEPYINLEDRRTFYLGDQYEKLKNGLKLDTVVDGTQPWRSDVASMILRDVATTSSEVGIRPSRSVSGDLLHFGRKSLGSCNCGIGVSKNVLYRQKKAKSIYEAEGFFCDLPALPGACDAIKMMDSMEGCVKNVYHEIYYSLV
ncbi:uncharacterized protein LOC110457559 [Mizuhopecten yessoensis]|uniref:uncharacterized protein LOC110457559 n=1 Tax=Mizuhopecten yessoensis TaxID=6573 RepID=UPI000B457983|nr:uncharacterized protein LOC110457559 [Mizuhopecten yessoensis]